MTKQIESVVVNVFQQYQGELSVMEDVRYNTDDTLLRGSLPLGHTEVIEPHFDFLIYLRSETS
jgi:hypothetical protein